MTLHNPENLTPEQVGEGWRLLTDDEIKKPLPDDAEYWCECDKKWLISNYRGNVTTRFDKENTVYRTRSSASPLVSRLTAEIAEKQALLAILPAIEAGAEWEVQQAGWDQWHKPVHTLKYYLDGDTEWLIRLKPAPELAPLWDCAKDVPLKAWARFKNSDDLYNLRNIEDRGIGFASFHVNWSELDRIEYTLDGETFHECRKGGPR